MVAMGAEAIDDVAMEGYYLPDFRAPLDADRAIRAVPQSSEAKGLYFRALLNEAAQYGQHLSGYGPYRDFKDYPQREAARLLDECARRMYPDEPLREGLRRLGWVIFPALLGTMAGRVIYASLGNDMTAVVRNAYRGFDVSLSDCACDVRRAVPGIGELSIQRFHLFPDCFLVGILEGAFAYYDLEVVVKVRPRSRSEVDFLLLW